MDCPPAHLPGVLVVVRLIAVEDPGLDEAAAAEAGDVRLPVVQLLSCEAGPVDAQLPPLVLGQHRQLVQLLEHLLGALLGQDLGQVGELLLLLLGDTSNFISGAEKNDV